MTKLLRLAEEFARRLSSDLSVVAHFRGPLSANPIDRGAIALQRRDRVWDIVRESLGMRPPPARPRRRKQQHKDSAPQFPPHCETRGRLQRPLPEDARVAEIIGAKLCELCEEVRNEEYKAVGYNPKTGEREAIPAEKFFRDPPSLLSILANQFGRYEDVMLERVRERAEEPAAEARAAVQVEPARLAPGNRVNGTDMRQEPEEVQVEGAPAEVAAVQDLRKRKNKGGRPPKDYKQKVINETVKWLDDEGAQPTAKIIEHMREIIAEIDRDRDGGPCASTMQNWKNEVLARFQALPRFQRQRGTIRTNTARSISQKPSFCPFFALIG